jgi:hypothetical protein
LDLQRVPEEAEDAEESQVVIKQTDDITVMRKSLKGNATVKKKSKANDKPGSY